VNIPKEQICLETKKIIEEIKGLRHLLHQIPEEGFREVETATLISNELKSIGLSYKGGLAETGIVVRIKGDKPGGIVAFRSDMDGVRQSEHSIKPYTSKNDGYSHSCGHDGHISNLLGVIKVLDGMREYISGEILFIFQPGEESGQGAKRMIESNALGVEVPKCIFALHAWPYIEAGDIAAKPGIMTSGNEAFKIVLRGSGGHGARHYETDNPINCASKIIPQLYALTTLDKDKTAVVSIGHVNSGSAPNVIPEELVFGGTIRTPDRKQRDYIHNEIEKVVRDECMIEGVDETIEYYRYCPPVVNDVRLYELFNDVAMQMLPEHKVKCLEVHSTGSEDFAYYSAKVPIFMFRIGVGLENGLLHSCHFDFNDDALFSSIVVSSALLLAALDDEFVIEKVDT